MIDKAKTDLLLEKYSVIEKKKQEKHVLDRNLLQVYQEDMVVSC
jgi:hypothetical protein